MNLLEVIAVLRKRLADEGGDVGPAPPGYTTAWESDDSACLWSNDELTGFVNEARIEYARRVGLLDDATFTLAVIAGTAVYALDPAILAIQRVANSRGEPLGKVSHEQVDWSLAGYPLLDRDAEQVLPGAFYYEDRDQAALRLFGVPVVNDTLTLTVQRLPLVPLTWADRTTPDADIPAHHQSCLVYWAAYLAYLKRDADTHAPALAQQNLLLFASLVGAAKSAQQERWDRMLANRRPRTKAQYY